MIGGSENPPPRAWFDSLRSLTTRHAWSPSCLVLTCVYTFTGVRMQRKYSEALKLKAVYDVETGELSRKGAARKYGCDPASIRSWVRKYGSTGWHNLLKERAVNNEDMERIKKLEREIENFKIMHSVYDRMFQIAKDEMGIDLKKNFDTEVLKEKEAAMRSAESVKPSK